MTHQLRFFAASLLVASFHSLGYFSQNAYAELDPDEITIDTPLTELLNIKVTSASKQPKKMSEAPAIAQVITSDEIARYGYRTLMEALSKRVIGLYQSNDRNYGYLGVRGFSRPGDFNTRILLLIDGHRVNEPLFDQAYLNEDLPVDINDIDRIEVLKGPGSALWGTNALLAVINVITKRGLRNNGATVITEYGSNDRRKGTVQYGDILSSGLEFATSFTAYADHGSSRIYFPEFDSPETGNGLAINSDEEEAYRGYIKSSFKDFTFLFISNWRKKTIPTGSYDTIFPYDGEYSTDKGIRTELDYENEIFPTLKGKLFARAYYDNIDYYGDYPYASEHNNLADIFRDDFEAKVRGAEVRYSQPLTTDLSVIGGVEIQETYDLVMSNYLRDPYEESFYIESDSRLHSGYLQGEYAIVKDLTLTAGARVDDYSTLDTQVSPRAAAVYKAFDDTTFKLLFGEAFRAPNPNELNANPATGFIPNANLTPEEITTLELGVEQIVTPSVAVSATAFHYKLKNLIDQKALSSSENQYQNSNGIQSYGVETEITTHLTGGIQGFIGITGLHSEDDETGDKAVNSPDYLAHGGVSFPVLGDKIFISPQFNLVGDRQTAKGGSVGSQIVADLTLSSKNILEFFNISAGVYNIFDERLESPGAAEHRQDKIPNESRTYRIQLVIPFH